MTLTLSQGETGTVEVTKTPDLTGVNLTVSIDADNITTDINQLTQVISFTANENAEAGDYTATLGCGEADPVAVTITVTEPEPPATQITANPTSLSVGTGSTGTTTVTKSPDLAAEDISVTISEENITTEVNQSTGVVTFSVGEYVHIGDYVATLTCGEAEPVEITITVTAPTTTEIKTTIGISTDDTDVVGITRLGSARKLYVHRTPLNSQSPVSYSIGSQAEKFTVEVNQYNTFDDTTNKALISFTQNEVSNPRGDIPLVITCGDVVKNMTLEPK